MAKLTLDDIRDSVEKKFVSTEITVGDVDVRMVNPMRLDKHHRSALSATLKAVTADGDDDSDLDAQFAKLLDVIRAAIPDGHQANVLIESIGDDMAVAMEVLDAYMEEMKPGEALASQS